MIKKLAVLVVLLLGLSWGVWAMVRRFSPAPSNGISVTASYYPLYDFARQVGGDRVHVTNMTPAGAEPHDFEPSAKALATAQDSKVLIYNGGTLEPWSDKFTQQYKGIAVKASNNVTLRAGEPDEADGHEHDDGHDHVQDPHFWLDPVLAQQIVNNIRDGLRAADPEHAEIYTKNAAAYNRQLADLDRDYREGLQQCAQRTVVASHQAMSYLAARYNFKVEAIAGLSPESEPSAARLAALTRIIREQNIGYIFFERLVSPRLAATIASETGAKTLVFDPIEGLTDEAQKAGQNYLSIQRENLASLRRALACN